MEALEDRVDAQVLVPEAAPSARAARRDLAIHGWPTTSDPDTRADLTLARFPHPAEPTGAPAGILAAVDELQLSLPSGSTAIILGPSGLLCDALDDPDLERGRDALLRLGRLRCVVRTPRGVLTGSPRQTLGLWVVADPPTGVPLEKRWLAGADLTGRDLTADVRADLATDVVAAAGEPRLARTHAFRFARLTPTATVLATRGPLVVSAGSTGAPSVVRPAEAVLAVRDLLASLDAPAPRRHRLSDVFHVDPSDRPMGMPSAPLGDLVTGRRVRLIPGTRLDTDLLTDTGTVRVITTEDLDHPAGESAMADPIELHERHPGLRRTEPGDVVFRTSPRPRALIDRDGGSVVAAPARILRCPRSAGLVPEAVAAVINALPDRATDWRTWPVPLVDPADADPLARALRHLQDEQAATEQRLTLLHDLTEALIGGVARRAITLTDPQPEKTEEGH